VKRIVVPYHHAEPLRRLVEAFDADDAIVVSAGPAGAMVQRIHDQIAVRVAASDEPVIVASGDCTTALPVVAGLQRRGLAPSVVWLDAHADFETPQTTRSGDLCRLALAMLIGRGGTSLRDAGGLVPLRGESCVLVGARDVDAAETGALAAAGVQRIDDLADLAGARLPPPPWYVHLDLDLIDPATLPPVRFPAPNGPTTEAVAATLRELAARGPIAALGLACTFTTAALRADEPLAALRRLSATFSPSATVGK
jgi:arginase